MSEKDINKHMLRDRAKKLPEVTDEMWNEVNKEFRDLVNEYISSQSHSPHTKKQYLSMLRQFGWFICDSLNNKPIYKIKKRGYEHEYIFTKKYGSEIKEVESEWANYFCSNVLSNILGRRINPHLFKSSCITHLLEQGIDMKLVSKFIAHHSQISTTIAHYDLRDHAEEKNNIFGTKQNLNI